jgi:hypothetical protein
MSTNSVSIAHEIGHGLGANHHGDREYDPIGDSRGQNVLVFDDSGHPLPTSGSAGSAGGRPWDRSRR